MLSAELGTTLEKYVGDLVAHGRYGSKSEVLREGVRLVQDREEQRAWLASQLDKALAASRTDDGTPADQVFDRLERKYEAMAQA